MVLYCCVNGCTNNLSYLQENPAPAVSFFAFPTDRVQRLKWLHAIGKPNWDPPATAKVCSAHFRADHIMDVNNTFRISDHIVPDMGMSPGLVDLGISDKQVCRICLATDLKMYSITSGYLHTCMSGIVGFNDTIKGLPQCVCYECAALLVKSYRLVEKSNMVQAALLNLFTRHGPITYSIIKRQDRTAMNLKSHLRVDKNVSETFEYVNDDEDDTPLIFIKRDPKKEPNAKSEDYKMENRCKMEEAYVHEGLNIKADSDNDIDIDIQNDTDNIDDIENENHVENDEVIETYDRIENNHLTSHDIKYNCQLEDKTDVEEPSFAMKAYKTGLFNSEDGTQKRNKNKPKIIGDDGLTEDERELQKYFKIVKLTLEEQIEDFRKVQKSKSSDFIHECDVCTRMFTNTALLKRHMGVHDSRRGEAECPVCRHRYRNQGLVNAHSANAHGYKFICNACPKVFRNIGMARKHQLEHAGLVYQCPHCAFTTAFEASLGVHGRYMHAGCRCGRCTRTFIGAESKAEAKGKGKSADGAFKENRFKKCKKRKKPEECGRKPRNPDALTTCKLCGVSCPSAADLKAHRRAEHAGQYKNKKTWLMPGDSYPTKCEHCSTMLSCRKEHWAHVRRSHPDEKASYRSVITAVCEVCGQGFQNTGRLRLHELRHGQPTVPCELCNKMFYDKFLLAIHMETHSDARPYRCQTCGKGFKTRSNLDKHHRTHSDVAAYTCKLCGKKFKYSTSMNLHIRTVHHKIPLPPRKRKSRKNAAENS